MAARGGKSTSGLAAREIAAQRPLTGVLAAFLAALPSTR
jgi:hypothetical protein